MFQNQKEAIKLMREIMEERRSSLENCKEDFLQQVVDDMGKEKFLTDDFVVHLMFGLLLASFETISSTLTLAIILLSDHPSAVQQLAVNIKFLAFFIIYFWFQGSKLFHSNLGPP